MFLVSPVSKYVLLTRSTTVAGHHRGKTTKPTPTTVKYIQITNDKVLIEALETRCCADQAIYS